MVFNPTHMVVDRPVSREIQGVISLHIYLNNVAMRMGLLILPHPGKRVIAPFSYIIVYVDFAVQNYTSLTYGLITTSFYACLATMPTQI